MSSDTSDFFVVMNGDPSSFTSQTHCPPLRSQEKSLGRIELGPTEIVSNIAGNLFSTHSWVKQKSKTIEIGGGGAWVVVEEGTSMKAVTCVEVRVREWSRLW